MGIDLTEVEQMEHLNSRRCMGMFGGERGKAGMERGGAEVQALGMQEGVQEQGGSGDALEAKTSSE